MSKLALRGIAKRYGDVAAVSGVDLELREGEFVSLLGPSGCGKTTTLRMIAGFISPSAGTIEMNGQMLSSPSGALPPEKRQMSMIFQSYAVWPNMTVAQNVAFGLELRKLPREEVRRRTAEMLEVVHMGHLAARYPAELSGGQQQRVALARAIVIKPQVLLLDEPLSNLDAKVRLQLRSEIKALQSRLGFAVLHVTHDREEAMTMADRIVVMDQGRIAQVGSPEDVYHRPNSPFVATFMGADNTIALKIGEGPSGAKVEAGPHHEATPLPKATAAGPVLAYFRDDVARIERPEHRADGEIALQGKVMLRSYPGGHYRYAIAVGDREYMVRDARLFEVGADESAQGTRRGSHPGRCFPPRSAAW